MCGISGIVDKMDKRVEEQEIKKINDLIKHRGPDDEGFYFSKNFAFGHRRLSIIDLSDAGHQPMQYIGKSGEYIITYNGEIYNYLEIKEELLEYGYTFISNTDTEVILASYDRWGEDCVNRFKFFGEVTLGRFLGLMLFETILKGPTQFDSITYVPLHRKKIIKRGYNQAEVIAKILGKKMGVRKEKLLVKIKENPPQSSMDVDDRKRNVKGVFALSRFKKVPESVLIVDDIYTTGNTMGECARLLKESGVRNIYGGVLAIDYLL